MRKLVEAEDSGIISMACGDETVLLYVDGRVRVFLSNGKIVDLELPSSIWDGVVLYYEKPYVLVYDGVYKLIEVNAEKRELKVVQELKLNFGTVKVRGKYVLAGDLLMRLENKTLKTVLRDVEATDGRFAIINKGSRRELIDLKYMRKREVPIKERVYCISKNMLIFGNASPYVGDLQGNKLYPVDFPSCMVDDVVYSRDKVFMVWNPTDFEKVGHVNQMVKCGDMIYVVTSKGLIVFEREYKVRDVMISNIPLKVSFQKGKYYLRTKAEVKKIWMGGERVGVSDECVAIYRENKVFVRCGSREKVYHVGKVTWMEGRGDKIAVASSEGVYVIDSEGHLDGCHASAVKAKVLGNKLFFFSPVDGLVGICEKTWKGLTVTNVRRLQNIIDFEVGRGEVYALFSTYEAHGVHVEVYDTFLEHVESFMIPPSRTICFGREFKALGNSLYVLKQGSHDLVFRYEQCKGDALSRPLLAIYDGKRVRETLIPANDSDGGREVVVTNAYGTYVVSLP